MQHQRGWKIIILLVLFLFTTIISPLISTARAADCTNSPTKFGITFEKSSAAVKFPGRFFIAFRNPLPEDYSISGGTILFWKTDGMYTYFRVSGVAPWGYRLHWEGNCSTKGSGSW